MVEFSFIFRTVSWNISVITFKKIVFSSRMSYYLGLPFSTTLSLLLLCPSFLVLSTVSTLSFILLLFHLSYGRSYCNTELLKLSRTVVDDV